MAKIVCHDIHDRVARILVDASEVYQVLDLIMKICDEPRVVLLRMEKWQTNIYHPCV